MFSRSIGIGLLAAGSLTAAVGGAYVAIRSNAAVTEPAVQPHAAASVEAPDSAGAAPVAETEAVVAPPTMADPRRADSSVARTTPPQGRVAPRSRRVPDAVTPPLELPSRPVESHAPVARAEATVTRAEAPAARSSATEPAPSAHAQFDEVVLPASSVIGLEVETSVSSEQARTEDRVDARVTRDVYVDGRLVIPSHSRMIGAVTMVERGGKVKERSRLGVRFHTLVLDGGRQIALRTETIVREGESPTAESSRTIGGAAIGGAVLGAIMGGGKGALLGGATGAAGGTAVVMAGGRNAATLASGTIVTARLSGPVSVEIEKR
ncbi:MAG TPA: TrbI/VirB10 family protein [Vicinamibacterales bacterium]|nr:TrbI/VirB10 family protein [Vicinamibacterales bacterium]